MIKTALIGATGYTGEELLALLLKHPHIEVTALSAKIDGVINMAEAFPRFCGKTNLKCELLPVEQVIGSCDVVFLALPHTVSLDIAPKFLAKGKKVIDLSADFRLKDTAVYEEYYKVSHTQEALLKKSVYGLPELYRKEIKQAELVANPGCYPTSVILACAPILKSGLLKEDYIIADSITGITGAGRKAYLPLHFSEANEDLRPYKVMVHQHVPEIKQELDNASGGDLNVIFTPHIAPLDRGILTTAYIRLNKTLSESDLREVYETFYSNEAFVRVLKEDELPRVKLLTGTNMCDIAVKVDSKNNIAIVMSAIDNLMKGASGQALQNFNIMLGFNETLGLI